MPVRDLDQLERIPVGILEVDPAPAREHALVGAMRGVHDCLEAADRLAEQGVSAEVIDLRTLRPLDLDTVLASVVKTNRVAVVEGVPSPAAGPAWLLRG